jgi:hypothetical protein
MYVLSVIREMRVRMPYGELKWEIQINPRRKTKWNVSRRGRFNYGNKDPRSLAAPGAVILFDIPTTNLPAQVSCLSCNR